MNVLITGAGGQLARELERTQPDTALLHLFSIDDLDICDVSNVQIAVGDIRPDVIINTAAYTAVDQAESDTELAFAVNEHGAANIAHAARKCNSSLVHISTDFVFDGHTRIPYLPSSPTGPLSVYGKSKLAGEYSIREILGDDALIVRGGWLYSSHSSNFVLTMIRVMNANSHVTVVDDQVGTPTWSRRFAAGIWNMIENNVTGIRHWGNSGSATWYEFAGEIYRYGLELGLIHTCDISPVTTSEYPTAASRPAFSVLDHDGLDRCIDEKSEDWKVDLLSCMREIANA